MSNVVRVPSNASPVTLRVLVHDALKSPRDRDAWLTSPLPHHVGFERAAAYFGVRLEREERAR